MRTWTIHLEMTPVAKGRPRFGRHTVFTPKKTKDFETQAKQLMRNQFFLMPLTGALRAEMVFTFPKPKTTKNTRPIGRPDADNVAKAVMDAGNGILWADDAQICELVVVKEYASPVKSPRIVIQLSELRPVV